MKESNRKAIDATRNTNGVAMPNTIIDMSLNTRRIDQGNTTATPSKDEKGKIKFDPSLSDSIDWGNLTRAEENALYSFVARHAYVQDIIANVITNAPDQIDATDPDFYSITLTRKGAEFFGTDNIVSMHGDLWDNLIYMARHPDGLKSIPVKLNGAKSGRIILQPYVIKIEYESIDKNSKGANISNLKSNVTHQVSQVRIMFAKYLYSDLIEFGESFTKVGKCLFAKIKYLIASITREYADDGTKYEPVPYMTRNGELFYFENLEKYKGILTGEEINRFQQWRENPLQPIQIYKAILYFARHDNGKSGRLSHDLIEFCNSVEPGVLRPSKKDIYDFSQCDENGFAKCIGEEPTYVFKDTYYKEKLKIDIYTRIFNILSYQKQITGMKFTNCRTFINQNRMELLIDYQRNNN